MSNTTRRLALVAATVVAVAGLAACQRADASAAPTTASSVTEVPAAPTTEATPTTEVAPAPTTAVATTQAPATTAAPAPTTVPAPATTVATPVVTRVVDGDTVEVSTGATIRLIGIDTPEVGQCGYGPAAQRLQALVVGKGVTLTPGARDDVDKYGRLLRYLDVAGTDAGYTLVQEGLAIARYDSRDGYGRHTRQDLYVAADGVSMNACAPATTVAAAPVAPVAPSPPAVGGTDPQFQTCKLAKANGYGPYYEGADPEYGWYRDADSDGIVCE